MPRDDLIAESGPTPPPGEVRLLRTEAGVVTVERADPVMWFAQHTLNLIREEPDPEPGWAFDGELITLDVANGRWVWKLTGRTWCHDYGGVAEPLVLAEAVWPD